MPVAIDLPFRISPSGGIATTRDIDRQVRQRLITIVGTEPTERVMLPQFGVPVAKHLFENDAAAIASELREMSQIQADWWEPALRVRTVVPVRDTEGNIAEIEMTYQRLAGPRHDELGPKIHQAEITEGGQVREWIRG